MTLRIKYIDHKFKDDHKISCHSYMSRTTGASYRIILNLESSESIEYYIRNERTKEYVVKSGKYTNLNVLKRKAREELRLLGVSIVKEIRNRTFGICPLGMTQEQWEFQEFYGKKEEEL